MRSRLPRAGGYRRTGFGDSRIGGHREVPWTGECAGAERLKQISGRIADAMANGLGSPAAKCRASIASAYAASDVIGSPGRQLLATQLSRRSSYSVWRRSRSSCVPPAWNRPHETDVVTVHDSTLLGPAFSDVRGLLCGTWPKLKHQLQARVKLVSGSRRIGNHLEVLLCEAK